MSASGTKRTDDDIQAASASAGFVSMLGIDKSNALPHHNELAQILGLTGTPGR